MVIVLSVASRVVTDIRITTTSDESNRAYFAAEAGVEEALRRLQLDPDFANTFNLNFEALNNTSAVTDVRIACSADCRKFVYPVRLAKDEVAQVAFLENFTNINSPDTVPDEINFYWGAPGTAPAAEISVLYYGGGDKFYIRKFGMDKFGRGGFCSDDVSVNNYSITDDFIGNSETLIFKTTINITVEDDDDFDNPCSLPGSHHKPVLARVRMLHNSIPSPFAVEVESGSLPVQGAIIESTGKSISGVTRKIRALRLHPSAPPFLDYVLFSGGTGPSPIRK